jgi:hypothetical protein
VLAEQDEDELLDELEADMHTDWPTKRPFT